ncbi:MAG: hypothetical protein KKF66_07480 [Actinobacteria bacterium]|nr:hypothetical protein [Actinomycetota bacterium]
MRFRLRFWAESISPPEILRHGLALLNEFSAGVGVALFEDSMTDENARAFRDLAAEGVEVVFWPLLPCESGYFPGEDNIAEFRELTERLIEWAGAYGVVPDMIAVDQELPFSQMREVLDAAPLERVYRAVKVCASNLGWSRYQGAKRDLRLLNSWIRERGIRTLSACLPWVALEVESTYEVIQDMMETPVMGVDWDVISPMVYVSMIVGMTGGLISERDANWLVFAICLALRSARGDTAGVSLGVTGTGVFENEPVFEEPEELLRGVEAALAAGVRDVSVYNLEGLLSRGNPRRWFEAVRDARPRVPPRSEKVVLALAAGRNIHPLLGRLASALSTVLKSHDR